MFAAARLLLRAAAKKTARPVMYRPATSYTAYLKKMSDLPVLKELGKNIPARGKLLGKMWRALSAKKKADFKKAGLKMRIFIGPKPKVHRKPPPFAIFLKKMMRDAKIKHMPNPKRMKYLADMWNTKKAAAAQKVKVAADKVAKKTKEAAKKIAKKSAKKAL